MKVKDKITGIIEVVLENTSNSYLVTRTKTNSKGINCSNWFSKQEFDKQFEKVN